MEAELKFKKKKYAVLSIRCNNPYVNPPKGKARILFSVCVNWPMNDYREFVKSAFNKKIPEGYSLYITLCDYNKKPIQWSQESKAKNRLRRLQERVKNKAPLFYDEFQKKEIKSKPSYYAGYTCIFEADEIKTNPAAFLNPTALRENYAPHNVNNLITPV